MIKQIKISFDIEDLVYVKMDPEQQPRIITGFKISKYDILYEASDQFGANYYYDFELSKNKDVVKATSN